MMDDKLSGSLPPPPPSYNPYSAADPSMRVAVSGAGSASALSPYLNIDPAYLGVGGGDSQFIFPEGASRTRGRLEKSFSQIGAACFLGGGYGGLNGLYRGVKDVQSRALIGANRRTQLLNFVAKGGASSAQTVGVISLMYSVFGVILSKARDADDELNTVIAGTATGLLFKSPAFAPAGGTLKVLKGGCVGLGLSLAYVLATNDKVKDMWR